MSRGTASLLAAGALLSLLSVRMSAAALRQSVPAGDAGSANPALRPAEPLLLHLPAGGRQTLAFRLCSGCFTEIRIEQLSWMVSAEVIQPGAENGLPRGLDAGVRSVIYIPLIGTEAGTYRLQIQALYGNLPAQVRVTLSALRPAKPGDEDRMAASEALAHAEQLRRVRKKSTAAKAIPEYNLAITLAKKTGDLRTQQLALLGKARVYLYRTGDYESGLQSAKAALALSNSRELVVTAPEEIALRAFTWKVISSAYSLLADYPKMIDANSRSLALYRQLGDAYWEGILEGNVANVYLETGDMQHALSSAEDGLVIARRLSDKYGIAFTEATLGAIRQRRGEYQAAFDANEAALTAMKEIDDPDEEGQVWMDQAGLYDDLNDLERERDALVQSLPLLRQTGDTANQSGALGDLALLDLREGRIHQAAETIGQAMEIARSHDLPREEAAAYLGQAEVLAAEGHAAQAMAAVRSGMALAAKAGETATTAMLLQEEGDIQARQRNTAAALAAYRKAEADWSTIPNLQRAALARASIARLEFRAGALGQANEDIRAALDGFEASRRQIGGRTLRVSFFASVYDFYDLAIAIELRRGNDTEAWRIAERFRARALMDAIRSSSQLPGRDFPLALMNRNVAVEKSIGATLERISQLGASGAANAAERRQTDKLHALVLEADDIEAREREAESPSLFGAALHPPTLAAMRKTLLSPQTALLEYWVGRHSIELWAVTNTSVRAVCLGATSTLDAAVRAYRSALLAREVFPPNEDFSQRKNRIAAADREAKRQAAVLGDLLLPVRLPASLQRLLIVPDGVIASISFAGLRLSSGEYLVQRYEVVEEPSASVAMALVERPSPRQKKEVRIAVFADPVYNNFDPRLGNHREGAQTIRVAAAAVSEPHTLRSDTDYDLTELPRLRGSLMEARAIEDIAGADRVKEFLGFAATPAAAMRLDWRNYSIADFAAHAIVNPAHPELSGIVLSMVNRDSTRENGVLWLNDIYRTPMPVSLVVLSGCGTAGGKAIPGEGISGLAQAFLSSGASGVVGTLWSVNDQAAGKMVPWFYRALLDRNLNISASLRMAQLRMLAGHQPPYDWAGYLVEGNWRAGIFHRVS